MVFTRNIIFRGSVIEDKKMGTGHHSCPGHRSKIGSEMVLNGGDYSVKMSSRSL